MLDIGVERFSSPFFFEPYYNARIPKSIVESDVQDSEDFIYGEWLVEKMSSLFGEFKNFRKS